MWLDFKYQALGIIFITTSPVGPDKHRQNIKEKNKVQHNSNVVLRQNQ